MTRRAPRYEPRRADQLHTQSRARTHAATLALALLTVACADPDASSAYGFDTGPTMQPGDNCLRCHRTERTDYPEAPPWTAAGTVFPGPDSPTDDGVPGVQVLLLDPVSGVERVSLTTNSAGNFYTDAELPSGFRVALVYEGERIEMPCAPPSGGCAACHNQPAIGGAPGRLFIPQAPEAANVSATCDTL